MANNSISQSKPVFKVLEEKKVKVRYSRVGKSKRVHIDLKRYKKGKEVDTHTLYNSIVDGEKVIGIEIMWDNIRYCEIWLDTQRIR